MLELRERKTTRRATKAVRSEPADKKTWRVLVVEDNPIAQLIALQQLTELGCIAHSASSGAAALEANRAESFDLIFMDCGLPFLDGYETVRAIRTYERNTLRNRVPIVALTANTDSECVGKCVSAGMDGYFSKPMTVERMRNVLVRFTG